MQETTSRGLRTGKRAIDFKRRLIACQQIPLLGAGPDPQAVKTEL
jgi:hypothetical protein